jgi:hypothetical protein
MNWLTLFKEINRCLHWESHETYKYTLCKTQLLNVNAGGSYIYNSSLKD